MLLAHEAKNIFSELGSFRTETLQRVDKNSGLIVTDNLSDGLTTSTVITC